MKSNRFETPVTVRAAATGTSQFLNTANEASDFLMKWPGKKGPKHRAALQACHDVISGSKPAMNARRAVVAAAREADILVSDKAPA
jgi:hypothetical protein